MFLFCFFKKDITRTRPKRAFIHQTFLGSAIVKAQLFSLDAYSKYIYTYIHKHANQKRQSHQTTMFFLKQIYGWGGTIPDRFAVQFGVLLDSQLLLEEQLWLGESFHAFEQSTSCAHSSTGRPAHHPLSPCNFLFKLLQYALHGVLIEQHSETSTDSKCSCQGNKWCQLHSTCNTTTL